MRRVGAFLQAFESTALAPEMMWAKLPAAERGQKKTSTCAVQTLLRTRSVGWVPHARFLDPTTRWACKRRYRILAPAGTPSVRQKCRRVTNTAEVFVKSCRLHSAILPPRFRFASELGEDREDQRIGEYQCIRDDHCDRRLAESKRQRSQAPRSHSLTRCRL